MPRPTTSVDTRARTSGGLYKTANLNFATYLHATRRLAFDHCEPHERYSEFYFRDPEETGPALWTEYCTKDLPVSARLLLETRTALLNEIRGRV
jgi:hypothetical protein